MGVSEMLGTDSVTAGRMSVTPNLGKEKSLMLADLVQEGAKNLPWANTIYLTSVFEKNPSYAINLAALRETKQN